MFKAIVNRSVLISSVARGQVRTAYSATIIEHFENPKNVGSLDKNKTSVGTGLVGAPACGLLIKEEYFLINILFSFLL